MENVEYFIEAIRTQDTHKRLKIGEDLNYFLKNATNISGSECGHLLDGLLSWVSNSNFKVSSQGLEILGILAYRMGPTFKVHVNTTLPLIVDRLGDSKQLVRDHALDVIFKLMDPVSKPQFIIDLLFPYFNHKNWRVREVLMICLSQTINRFESGSLQINKFTPCLAKLLSDPTGQVRDTAISTLVEIYRHVGEKLRVDISKGNIPESKLKGLFAKFDEVSRSGDMVSYNSSSYNSVTDGPPSSTPSVKKSKSIRRSTSFSAGDKKRSAERHNSGSSSGAVDESDFITAWEEVAEAKLFSMREFPKELERINDVLSNQNGPWEKRVDALRNLREMVKISVQVEHFHKMCRDLETALRISVKDLRSSVVREACLTLSYMSYVMENKFDQLAEALLLPLITMIPNSTKIMSTSANAAIRLTLKNTSSARFIPVIVTSLLTSKSKEIKRRCAEYVCLLLELWDTSVIKGHVALIEEAIRKGISDADSETRAAVRRAYWLFADHYKNRADTLMQQFDSSKQKLLQSDKNLINSSGSTKGSYDQLNSAGRPSGRSASDSSTQKIKKSSSKNGIMGPPISVPSMQRSASQMDSYRTRTPKMTPRQKSCDDFKRNNVRSAARERRPKYNPGRSAASQPSSRNTSPRRMPSYSRERSEDFMKTYSPQKTRIPTPNKPTSKSASRSSSRHSSRDPSPTRTGYDKPRTSKTEREVTEDALWDALKRSRTRRQRKTSQGSTNGGSDESDASSMSSHNTHVQIVSQEYDEILALVQGSSTISKRDGLISLQAYLHGMNTLTTEQVIRMKEAFNQYFAEPNNKLYSAFLDVVSEFIVQHKNDLKDWLFVLLTRLLQRISTDYLSSSQKKIARVLDVVRDSYPYDHQFHIITKYINDKSQTPSLKLKVALLEYTRGLIQSMDPSDFVSTPTVKLAVSKIVTWISEPKSADVRKEASLVIVALFQLNSPEFSNMLSNVPNSIHEGATRVIKMHLRQVSASASRTPTDETPNTPPRSKSFDSPYDTPKHPPATTTSIPRSKSASKYSRDDYSGGSHVPGRPDTQVGADAFDSPMKGVSTLNFDSPDAPSPYTDHSTSWLTKDTTMDHRPTTNYEASLLSKSFAEDRKADGAEQPTTTKSPTGVETERMMEEICAVLSQTQISDSEDIKNALLEFHRVMRSDDKTVSLVKIRSILPTVVQLLQHKEATLRCLAARALRELAFTYPEVYRHDLETFLLPLLQAEADPQKAVSKTAEECCTIVSQLLPAGEIIPVLAPLCGGESPFPTNLSAIQLLHNISDSCNADELRKYLEPVVTNLLAAYDHTESQVRKAAVFCLVSVHNKAGESAVTPYFKDLAASKMKLLNLYIRRSQSANV